MLSSCRAGYSCGRAGVAAGAAGCCGGGSDDSEPERLVIDETGTGSDCSEEVDVLTVDASERKRTKVDGNDSAFGSFAGSPPVPPRSPFGGTFDRWGSFRTPPTGSRIDNERTRTNIDWFYRNIFWRDSGGGILHDNRRPWGFRGINDWRYTNGSDVNQNQRCSRETAGTGYRNSANDALSKDIYGRSWSHGETGLSDSRQGCAENGMPEKRRNSADTSVPEQRIESSVPKSRKRCANHIESKIQVNRKDCANVFESERPSVIVSSQNVVECSMSPLERPFPSFPSPPPDGISCKIITQPRSLMRFRYWSEYKDNRAANKIVGKDSTTENTTYPTVWIDGWTGKAVVVISLVQADNPQRLHPHSLLTPSCEEIKLRQGYIKREVHCSSPGTLVTLDNLCLIRNKKSQMVNLLLERYQKINPFGVEFDPKDATEVKSHVVRLCVEVYLGVEHAFYRLQPVVSDEIRNSGAHQTLKILKLGFCTPREDDYLQEVMILCDKVDKDDIEVEIVSLGPAGEALLKRVTSCDVFGQVNIVFRVSRDFLADNHQHTFVRLRRPSTKDMSEPFKFSPSRSISVHGVAERSPFPAPATRSPSLGPSDPDPTNLGLPTNSSGYTGYSENARHRPDKNMPVEGEAECGTHQSSEKARHRPDNNMLVEEEAKCGTHQSSEKARHRPGNNMSVEGEAECGTHQSSEKARHHPDNNMSVEGEAEYGTHKSSEKARHRPDNNMPVEGDTECRTHQSSEKAQHRPDNSMPVEGDAECRTNQSSEKVRHPLDYNMPVEADAECRTHQASEKARHRPDNNMPVERDAECRPSQSSGIEAAADNVPSDILNLVSNSLPESSNNDRASSYKGSYKKFLVGSLDQQSNKDISFDIRINKDRSQVGINSHLVSSSTSCNLNMQEPLDILKLLETKPKYIDQDVCDCSISGSIQLPAPAHPLDPYNLLGTNPENTYQQSEIRMEKDNRDLDAESIPKEQNECGDDAILSNILGPDSYEILAEGMSGLIIEILNID